MAIGEILAPARNVFTDGESGARITQLTDFAAHSHHLYFTNSGWYDGGRRLLVASDVSSAANLYGVDVKGDGSLTRLTDFEGGPANAHSFLHLFVNPARDEAYDVIDGNVLAVDLHARGTKTIAELPGGFNPSMLSVTADGRYICLSLFEDLSDRFPADLLHGYVGFREYHDARPLSKILKIPSDGSGPPETVWEERYWIGHVNCSPTLPNVLTFCHEGPWEKVDNRIWCLDHTTGKARPLRPRKEPGERIGHEYWLADGEHVAYHGHRSGKAVFGAVRYDGSQEREAEIVADSTHFHSNDLDLVVGDGTRENPRLLLWKIAGRVYEPPRVLAFHRGSWHTQILHVHPRMTTDGGSVVYTADPRGYGNVYIAEIPDDLESLPVAAL